EFAVADTASMVLFVGNPTNAVICEGLLVKNAAFTAYTILPFLGCSMICLAVLVRKHKYIPHCLSVTDGLYVRSVLLEMIGVCVGGALLRTCLIVIIIVSSFHIDALPFARNCKWFSADDCG
ncbi:hypothetical protein H2248_003367, partial [Termitomyces sp. 'cryptogamus']